MGPMTVSVVECPEERVEVFGIHAAKATEQHGAFLNLLRPAPMAEAVGGRVSAKDSDARNRGLILPAQMKTAPLSLDPAVLGEEDVDYGQVRGGFGTETTDI